MSLHLPHFFEEPHRARPDHKTENPGIGGIIGNINSMVIFEIRIYGT